MKTRGLLGLSAVVWLACGEQKVPPQPEPAVPHPAVLVRVEEEAVGTACALGGKAIRRGTDRDGDGQLTDAEVESVDYVCRTEAPSGPPPSTPPAPPVLLTQTPEAPGMNCSAGGVLVRAGADTNRDGVLDDEEVTKSFYGCQPEPAEALAVLAREKSEPAGVHCAEGGVAIQAGTDANKDGVLSDDEVETTTYVCGEAARAVLTKSVPIAAGAQCVEGGTRVLAGSDGNGNNVLEDAEVTSEVVVCRARLPGWTYVGDYTIQNEVDVTALEGVGHISGQLRIETSTVEDIDLPFLHTVNARLLIQNNPKLKSFSMRLGSMGGSVTIQDNPALTSFSLSGGKMLQGDFTITHNEHLTNFSVYNPLYVSGNVTVEDNAALFSLGGLRTLHHIGGNLTVKNNAALGTAGWSFIEGPVSIGGQLTVAQNPQLQFFDTRLEQVGKDIRIQDNAKLSFFKVKELTSLAGGLVLKNNPVMTLLQGLESLRSVGGDLHLEGSDGLDVLPLDALEHVGGDFSFIDIAWVPNFYRLGRLLSISGNLRLTDNSHLGTPQFPHLSSVGKGVTIERNARMTHLSGLNSLRSLESLTVSGNPELLSLGALGSLRYVPIVNISDNPQLTTLGLPELWFVNHLDIMNNEKLSTCLATELRTQVATHLQSSTIDGNLVTPGCP